MIESTGKSGVLHVRDNQHQSAGSVSFNDGRIVAAKCGDHKDRDAVIAILEKGGTSFEFNNAEIDPGERRINEGTTGLLLEASRVLDEKD